MEEWCLTCQFVVTYTVGGPCTAHPAGDSTNVFLRFVSRQVKMSTDDRLVPNVPLTVSVS